MADKIKVKGFKDNPRKITEAQLNKLEESLRDLGDLSGSVYNQRTHQWVGGNQRSKIFNQSGASLDLIEGEYRVEYTHQFKKDKQGTVALGYILWEGKRYAYRQVDWSKEKEKRANIAANKLGGEWDNEVLREKWDKDLLLATGFSDREVVDIYGKVIGGESLKDNVEGEVKFSTELGRTADYIVLKFDHKVDFLQAKTLLGLESTYSMRQNGKPWSRGIGRVIDGAEAIDKLQNSGK